MRNTYRYTTEIKLIKPRRTIFDIDTYSDLCGH